MLSAIGGRSFKPRDSRRPAWACDKSGFAGHVGSQLDRQATASVDGLILWDIDPAGDRIARGCLSIIQTSSAPYVSRIRTD